MLALGDAELELDSEHLTGEVNGQAGLLDEDAAPSAVRYHPVGLGESLREDGGVVGCRASTCPCSSGLNPAPRPGCSDQTEVMAFQTRTIVTSSTSTRPRISRLRTRRSIWTERIFVRRPDMDPSHLVR